MGRRSGFLLTIEDGGKALMYHNEQEPKFKDLKKAFIHFLNEDYTPQIGEDGKEKTGLKSLDKLKVIGMVD